MPVGSGAVFEAATAPITSSFINNSNTPWVNSDSYSEPVYQASAGDPIHTIWDWNSDWGGRPWNSRTIRMPVGVVPAGGTDSNFCIVNPEKTEIVDAWTAQPWASGQPGPAGIVVGDYISGRVMTTNAKGTGFGPSPSTYGPPYALGGGIRGCGSSTAGGLIRDWEANPSNPNYTDGVIRHALAIAMDVNLLYYNGQHDPNWSLYDSNGYGLLGGYVWPATEEDSMAASNYHGSVPMGSFWAIPKTVNINSIGLTTAAGLVVAKACQDYGCYVSDATYGTAPSWYAEPSLAGHSFLDQLVNAPNYNAVDLYTIRAQLRRCTNSTSTSVGGGGTRPIALLPPFA